MPIDRDTIQKFIDASVNDHVEAQQLLDAHPELREANWLGGEPILSFLVIENFLTGVQFCLQNGFDANHIDGDFGDTPLHYACKLDYLDVARALLRHGANPNAVSAIDDTPIHCCIQNGNAELLDLLISHGADPRYTTLLGETVFDRWPEDREIQSALTVVLEKHNVVRDGESESP